MFKELLLAIILGALLGFGLTGGYVAVKKYRNTNPSATVSPTPTPAIVSPTPNQIDDNQSTTDHQVIIESPESESIVANSQITIKGTTSPQSYLIITGPSKTYYTSADDTGYFNIDIEIESGVNQIQIDSFDTEDNQATSKFLITYSTAKI